MMRIFVAGATGAVGRVLVLRLVRAGHICPSVHPFAPGGDVIFVNASRLSSFHAAGRAAELARESDGRSGPMAPFR
jgi:nucleoside-diphosphate-sugar epimerase